MSLLYNLFALAFDLDPSRGKQSSAELVNKLSIKISVLPSANIRVVRYRWIQTITSIISMIFFYLRYCSLDLFLFLSNNQ